MKKITITDDGEKVSIISEHATTRDLLFMLNVALWQLQTKISGLLVLSTQEENYGNNK